ncbi:MAG: sulfite exporter TauE/SafE family protein [Candidatus Schekmanbacteria bacterium]|nr:MAG: sulfite exporter TauE/SafE family protein [Candidatus Schekmanbacteria bacterium]
MIAHPQLILSALFFLVSIIFSMMGQGGGVIYTPLQVWFNIDFHTAATTSLFLILAASVSSSLVFRKAGKIDWPLALVLETSTGAGGFAGGFWSEKFSSVFLSLLFAGVIFVSAFFMINSFKGKKENKTDSKGLFIWKRVLNNEAYCVNLLLALPLSFAAGIISGLLGVGGGILKVPLMVILLGIPMDIAVGSSAFMIGITAFGGFAGHIAKGHWDWITSLVLAVAVIAGSQIGSRISVNIDKNKLKKAFGWFLFVIAISMVIKALW